VEDNKHFEENVEIDLPKPDMNMLEQIDDSHEKDEPQ